MKSFKFPVFLLAFLVSAYSGTDPVPFGIAGQTRAKLASHLPVKILCIGDSMSDVGYSYRSISRMLMKTMRNVYGDGGQGLDGWDLGSPISFDRPLPAGFFFGVSIALYPGEQVRCVQAGKVYYTESWWIPDHPYDRVGLFWYSYPGGGLFNVGITNLRSQTTELPTTTLSGYSSMPTIRHTNWQVTASGQLDPRVSGINNTNYLIGPEIANTVSGVEMFFFSHGGVSLSQQLSLGTNLLHQLWRYISPDLVIYHAKDFGPPPDSQDTNAIGANLSVLLSTLTNITTNIIIVGTPPGDDSHGQNTVLQNQTEKAVADAGGFGFVDLSSGSPDLAQNQAEGLMDDATHPSPLGASIWADEIAHQLGFDGAMSAPPRPVFQAVAQHSNTINFSWSATPGQRYQLQSKTDFEKTWSDLGASMTATNRTLTASDSMANEIPYRYYRVRFSK